MKVKLNLPSLIIVLVAAVGISAQAIAAVPTVTAVSPNSGPVTGGQLIRIYGSNFDLTAANNLVRINGLPAGGIAASASTATTCDFTTVAAVAGAGLSVTVTNVNGVNVANALYTFISRNNTLIVVVSDTVAKRAQIQWGNGTSLDDNVAPVDHTLAANRISNYAWTVKDSTLLASLQTDLGTIYRSDDAQNNKTINVSNVSSTGNACTISAIATKTAGNFNLAAAAGADVVAIKAAMGAGALTSIFAAQNLTVNLVTGTDQPLVLEFDTPTTVSTGNAGVLNTYNVTMTATAN
jgi:hypothetical protein